GTAGGARRTAGAGRGGAGAAPARVRLLHRRGPPRPGALAAGVDRRRGLADRPGAGVHRPRGDHRRRAETVGDVPGDAALDRQPRRHRHRRHRHGAVRRRRAGAVGRRSLDPRRRRV
ncbi:MAG: hypothetical protein AVDCRST_MAG41-4099, partial [uncultured Corynebacteriales bacterium]